MPRITTQPDPSFVALVNPIIEMQIFALVESVYASDIHNDWYASIVDSSGITYVGLLKEVREDTVILGLDFSTATDFAVVCDTVAKVTLWKVI